MTCIQPDSRCFATEILIGWSPTGYMDSVMSSLIQAPAGGNRHPDRCCRNSSRGEEAAAVLVGSRPGRAARMDPRGSVVGVARGYNCCEENAGTESPSEPLKAPVVSVEPVMVTPAIVPPVIATASEFWTLISGEVSAIMRSRE